MATPARTRPVLVAILLALTLFAAACGSKKSPEAATGGTAVSGSTSTDVTIAASGSPHVGGTLNVAINAESDGWDPTKNRWTVAGTQVGLAVFDPLAAYDADGNAQPYLAQSIMPNADFTEWTITLRSGITFSDGTPLTADVLKTIFAAHKASALTAPAIAALDSVKITGTLTAVFEMSKPWAAFSSSLTGQLGMVPSPGQLADPDGTQKPIGTGPFTMTTWTLNTSVKTLKNPTYWRKDESGTQLPYLDGVNFKVVTESVDAVDAVLSGDLDMGNTSSPAASVKADNAAKSGDLQLVESQGQSESDFAILNLSAPPFDSPAAREAIARATDTAAYRQDYNQGEAEESHTVFRPGTKYFADSPYPTYDLDKAKAAVAQYAQEEGKPLAFTFLTDASTTSAQQAQILQAQWKAAGMDVTIQAEESSKQIADAVTGNYQAAQWSQFGSPDPDYDYLWWVTANAAPVGQPSLNIARSKDIKIDQALDAARSTNDPEVRKQQYAAFSDRLNIDLPYIWFSRPRYLTYADNSVRGITQGPLPDGEPSYPMGGPGGFALASRLTQTWLDR